ncbi:MAG: DEAD/DEAH box helicase [Burkholderiales bacterium]|jgi:superfamily II DNA or RNA helicase|nr:DEAD/DEAH box helicase [Burkholderiales bacterium]
MNPGDRVRLIDNPSRIGVLTSDPPRGEGRRRRLVVDFPDGTEPILASSLERVEAETSDPYLLMQRGQYGGASHLRGAITLARLSGKLANLIYSLNTTNTKFLPYQFKPVLQFLDSPSRGIVIADEVGLGKTIEAGLIWTELRARQDARRLLVVCPAMLREKWCAELANRFGVKAQMVDAGELLDHLSSAKADRTEEFALVASMQGLRPPKHWNSESSPSQSSAAKLARFLEAAGDDEPLLDLVVVDEAHYLRNRGTQTHRFAALLRPVTVGLALLSATPIQMRSTDLFNLLHLLDEDAFPMEWTYDHSVRANAPIVALRDRLKRDPPVTQDEFKAALQDSIRLRWFEDSEQIEHLLKNLPTDDDLRNVRSRADYAELLDRLNPRAKVITRTLKREVDELRVTREPRTLRIEMSPAEREFYEGVTEAVQEYCESVDVSEGFLLTIPQRQMSSCMAAACMGWRRRQEEQVELAQETVTELEGDSVEQDAPASPTTQRGTGELLSILSGIARRCGDYERLAADDSKFTALVKNLKGYWRENVGKKVVLFAFYRNTLYYLAQRLAEAGVRCTVLHGGMDKTEVLRSFESDDAVQILLSSEVASEGVDLQFSSLLVNYDLPWNPARIEQRIGRIDRIGQAEAKILIWNLVYEDTLDERVHDRLLERLNVFRQALGSMEELLGAEVRKLTVDLLSHRRTPKQEEERIGDAAMALERNRRDEEQLNAQASKLLGHGDYIQNKAKAAMDLGRYIRGDDLYHFVKDYLEVSFPGSRVMVNDEPVRKGLIELSMDARVAFHAFLADAKLLGRTTVLDNRPRQLWFDNQAGHAARDVEKVTQDHPLVRFVLEQQKTRSTKDGYFPTSAVQLPASRVTGVAAGTYVYAVIRWTFSGPRDVERLVYEARCVETGVALDPDAAESLVNAAANRGTDWQAAAKNILDHTRIAALQDDCRAAIEEHFDASKAAQLRENRDRVREMNASLDADLKRKREEAAERIARYQASSNPRHRGLLGMERTKLRQLEQKYEERKLTNGLREALDPRQKDVSSGVIRVE